MERLPMITEARGNLLDADVDALVNTVNTVGVMGKGIALQFRRAYPDMFADYQRAVKAGEVQVGAMHVWPTQSMVGPRYVINFPTKRHWRSLARLVDIEAGLADLVRVVRDLGIRSLAVPPLGCGNGGLDWADVEPVIRATLAPMTDVNVALYPPSGPPAAADMPTADRAPTMTPGRAALVTLMAAYADRALEPPSLIECQKLMYFLQVAGEPLRLQFAKGRYGPYADNLRQVLRVVEGHYLVGFGDGSQLVREAEPLRLLPGALDAARSVLAARPETARRIARVLDLTAGFESVYGLELLATVHWLGQEYEQLADDSEVAIREVQRWSPRKGRMFSPEHIRVAWEALRDRGWLPVRASA